MSKHIIVDGKEFNTIKEAAEYYKCNIATISNALKIGIFYERIEHKISVKESKPKVKHNKKNHPITIDGIKYKSIADAAKAIHGSRHYLAQIIASGQKIYKNKTGTHVIIDQFDGQFISLNKYTRMRPVIIDGVKYDCMASAARAIGCHPKTIKLNLDTGKKTILGHTLEE